METEVIYVAQPIGRDYRGEVRHAGTYKTILVTAHNYSNQSVAVEAAKLMWAERKQRGVAA